MASRTAALRKARMTKSAPAAKAAYRDGIAAAERAGDAHARDEIAAALAAMEA